MRVVIVGGHKPPPLLIPLLVAAHSMFITHSSQEQATMLSRGPVVALAALASHGLVHGGAHADSHGDALPRQ